MPLSNKYNSTFPSYLIKWICNQLRGLELIGLKLVLDFWVYKIVILKYSNADYTWISINIEKVRIEKKIN